MTNREKYAKTPLEEVLEAYMRDCSHSGIGERLDIWLSLPVKADGPAKAGKPGSSDNPESPEQQANPLPGALGTLTGLLAACLAGRNGEPPHVNVWVMVNGRTA